MNYSILNEAVDGGRHEIAVNSPVRIVYEAGKPLFCGKDLAALFGFDKPYDAVANMCDDLRRIIVPHKQSPTESSIMMVFLPESEARRFVKKAASKRLGMDCGDRFTESFVDQLKLGRVPEAIGARAVKSEPSVQKARPVLDEAETSMREALRIASLCKKFVEDVRAGA